MLQMTTVPLEHIIGKIDNDFNPDNSDWIPRVGAWAIEAMQMLNVLRTETKTIKLKVRERIAYSECTLDVSSLKVYDEYGCEIVPIESIGTGCCSSSTGDGKESDTIDTKLTPHTVDIAYNPNTKNAPNQVIVETRQSKDYSHRYNVVGYNTRQEQTARTYTLIDNNKIELSYDAEFITIKYKGVKTCRSEVYGCDVPVIPNNALLIEAIGMWCMYKMLCRGFKHPVFNLAASQYGTNPYYMWNQLKEEAKRSVTIDSQGEIRDSGIWQSAFYNFTFNPRG